jgi:hypothetical protein
LELGRSIGRIGDIEPDVCSSPEEPERDPEGEDIADVLLFSPSGDETPTMEPSESPSWADLEASSEALFGFAAAVTLAAVDTLEGLALSSSFIISCIEVIAVCMARNFSSAACIWLFTSVLKTARRSVAVWRLLRGVEEAFGKLFGALGFFVLIPKTSREGGVVNSGSSFPSVMLETRNERRLASSDDIGVSPTEALGSAAVPSVVGGIDKFSLAILIVIV